MVMFKRLLCAAAVLLSAAANAAVVDAIEYHHSGFNHYFITVEAAEIQALDGGAFGGVWRRTGHSFKVHNTEATGTNPVCRFFSTSFAPKSSHFYTAIASECAAVRNNRNWMFEAIAYYAISPPSGTCSNGDPIYRLYNNGMSGAPNHRYTTSTTVRSQMIAAGWIPEGYGSMGVGACTAVAIAPPPVVSTAESMTANLVGGKWTFNYVFGSAYSDWFRFTSYTYTGGTVPYKATGTNKYGRTVMGGRGEPNGPVMIVSPLSTAWDIYTFTYPSTDTATGCYYFDYGQSNVFGRCTSLTGYRSWTAAMVTELNPSANDLFEYAGKANTISNDPNSYVIEASPELIQQMRSMQRGSW